MNPQARCRSFQVLRDPPKRSSRSSDIFVTCPTAFAALVTSDVSYSYRGYAQIGCHPMCRSCVHAATERTRKKTEPEGSVFMTLA